MFQETQFVAGSYEHTRTAAPTTVTPIVGHGKCVDGDHQNSVAQKCPEKYDCANGNSIHSAKDMVVSVSTSHKFEEEGLEFPEDNHVLAISTELEIKNDEDLNKISTTSSCSSKETK